MENVIKINESGYQKIVRECRSVDVHSTENDLRNVLQVILMIAQEETKKEIESNAHATNENI